MSHILAAIDFSDLTDAVVEQATTIGKALGARVTLLHVAAPDPDFVGYEVGPESERDFRAQELRSEHTVLLNRATELQKQGIDANAFLIAGPSETTILEKASHFDSDMIVIGSHGHGAIYDVLVGSVCAGVVKHATCPVLVVPHPRQTPSED